MDKSYKIFDSHAHYDDESFDEDREFLLNEIQENGVIGAINCSSSYESVKKTCEIIKKWPFIYGAVGIHPQNADELTDKALEEFRSIIKSNDKIVAVGEIGLDYYWDENPSKDIQKNAFRNQMKLAKEFNLPVIIHDRDAHMDTLQILKEFPTVIGTVHCFSGSVEFAKECLKLGYYIGITGVVTFKNSKKIIDVIKEVPIEKLLVETDCPYMSPEPNRGKINRSDYIEFILDKIAEIKDIDKNYLNKRVNENIYNLMTKIHKK